VRVFEQQKLVGYFVALAPFDEIALQRVRCIVGGQT
jgi:hypothetical protein